MNVPAVHASHLSKSFGAKRVLQDLSFSVEPGDIVGVLGKNGAGKTTLLELMLGFTAPTGGEVRVFGHESSRMPAAVKARVGFVPQQDELLGPLTVRDQLRVIASFYPRWDEELVARLCREWHIDTNQRIKGMSVGERQKLSIVLAFGHRPDLMLGTARPWLLAGAQVLPILITARIGFYSGAVWLYFLTLFSTVSGAIAGQAAERSRALWLRAGWSRAELFSQVERSFWRHNGFVLAVLLFFMVAIGTYADLPLVFLAVGLPLLVLGMTLSTYLGLMITRGLRVFEAGLAVALMLALMAVAVIAARPGTDPTVVIALELILAGAVPVLRSVAQGRWTEMDWMQCRTDRALHARPAS